MTVHAPSLPDLSVDTGNQQSGSLQPDMAVSELRQRLMPWCAPRVSKVAVPLRECLSRVLADDIHSPFDVPPHDNSAMDGYAFASQSLTAQDGRVTMRVVGTALAGQPCEHSAAAGECIRIMTGALIPSGCDTVIAQESVKRSVGADGEVVSWDFGSIRSGDNVRRAGEDLRSGDVAIPRGRLLRPADLGLLASLGVASVEVYRPLRVAFLTSGDELRSPGEPLTPGSIYDSNRYTLMGMLQRLGCIEAIEIPPVRDDAAALEGVLSDAASRADVLMASGGMSVGEADHTRAVMERLGDVRFCSMAIRPGRPFAIAQIRNGDRLLPFFGLPGNPVATMVTFYAIVRDCLLAMAGALPRAVFTVQATLAQDIRKRPGRTEYQRVRLMQTTGGEWQATLTGQQGSGILRSMAEADGLMVLAHDQGSLKAGDRVDVLPFEGLV